MKNGTKIDHVRKYPENKFTCWYPFVKLSIIHSKTVRILFCKRIFHFIRKLSPSNKLHFNPFRMRENRFRRFLIVCMKLVRVCSVIPIKVVEFRNTRVFEENLQQHSIIKTARFKCIRTRATVSCSYTQAHAHCSQINDSVHKFCITFSHHCNSISLNLI